MNRFSRMRKAKRLFYQYYSKHRNMFILLTDTLHHLEMSPIVVDGADQQKNWFHFIRLSRVINLWILVGVMQSIKLHLMLIESRDFMLRSSIMAQIGTIDKFK